MEFVFLLLTATCFFFFSITNYHFCGILASSHQLYNLLNEYNHSEERWQVLWKLFGNVVRSVITVTILLMAVVG